MTWSQITEQPRVTDLLQASLTNDRLAHAYLFTGPRGTGKMRIAMHLAKSIFCRQHSHDACEQCVNCQRISGGNHPDVFVVRPDGASIKIDQIRALQKEMTMRSLESPHKVYVIEHVDKMTVQAANSLLKFLEEPPKGVVAILLTENSHALLPTILSRCQIIPFSPLPVELLASQLIAEGIPSGMAHLACQITTQLDEARELSQSDWFAQLRNEVIQLSQDCKQRGSYALYSIQELFVKNERLKEELPLFLDMLILWLRDVLYVQVGRHAQLIYRDQQDMLERQAYVWTQAELMQGIGLAMDTRNRIERNANPQLALERLVLQLQGG
ncbi:DNA polymerase III subunit delta' [Brevibacillus humidisoli]|uniref:DNA polymerase III subunit delta' n=1 Tax=Brevibacillus humidisoli TaxID=2895522 RepID=UPI001E5D7598|nr:DNA polymerase III subunit delta' [Brevibacillus humidisoli]UFJ40519.1 DNA polymerase III subunit delta' [Brevibacillus humidisoli]